MYQVKGRWALITGAARGIGYLTAKFMAEQGCNLILHSRDLSHTEKVLEETRAMGVEALAVEADLNDPELKSSVERLPEIVSQLRGIIQVLEANRAVFDDLAVLQDADIAGGLQTVLGVASKYSALDSLTQAQQQNLAGRMREWLAFGEEYDIFTQRTEILFTPVAARPDPFDRAIDDGLQGSGHRLLAGNGDLRQVIRTFGHRFGNLLRGLAGSHHRISHVKHHALPQYAGRLEGIDHHIGKRDLVFIDAVDAQQAADGALHGNRGVAVGERLHVFGNRPRQGTRPVHLPLVQSKFTFIHIVVSL